METRRLLAVDPSLTCSGWALFSTDTGRLGAVGKIRSLPSGNHLAARLLDLQQKITDLFQKLSLTPGDIVICEAPTTMRDPRAAFKVEQVRGIFEALARDRSISVPGRINPRSVHYEVMGLKGKQLPRDQIKQIATQVVRSLYEAPLVDMGFDTSDLSLSRHQDIVDAILIGSLAVTWVQAAVRSDVTVESYLESRKIKSRRSTMRDFGRKFERGVA